VDGLAVSAGTIGLVIVLGLAAGTLAGLFGVGGGILFVPMLVALGLAQVEAQATSLLAIVPIVVAGTWNQRRYGNVDTRSALILGAASIVGVEIGARVATSLDEATLRRAFGVLVLLVAAQLAYRSRRRSPAPGYPDSP
jgi:uncharacterized membrane protein YfcA